MPFKRVPYSYASGGTCFHHLGMNRFFRLSRRMPYRLARGLIAYFKASNDDSRNQGSVKTNPSLIIRTARLTAGRWLVVAVLLWAAGVRAACPASFSPSSRSHGYARAAKYVDFSATCRWMVINTNSWITFTSATNGVAGSGRLYYTVALNSDSRPRSGNIRIGNANFLITQAGGHPVIVTPPVDQSVAAGGTALVAG